MIKQIILYAIVSILGACAGLYVIDGWLADSEASNARALQERIENENAR